MRRTKEQRIADMEAEAAALKRKLRMETVPGVKEAVFLARALAKWRDDHGDSNDPLGTAIAYLNAQAEVPLEV